MSDATMSETGLSLPAWPGLAGRQISLARAEDIVTGPLRHLYAWWTERCAVARPTIADFDITQFPHLAAHLYLAAPVASGFELRLAGEEYIRLFGLKKGWIWHRDASDPVMRDSASLLTFVSQHFQPLHTIGRLELAERHWVELEALICPLAGATPADSRILGCVAALDQSVGADLV